MMSEKIKETHFEMLAEYQKNLYEKPALQFLFFELTDQCNLHCLHCGSSSGGENRTFLPYFVVERVLQRTSECYSSGDIMICLTGGEPILHPDLCKIVRKARELGFTVGITSNGTLIDEKMAYSLAQAGMNTVSISVDGIGAVHDRFRMSEGSFDKAMRGIRALKKAGIEPQVTTVVHRENLVYLHEIYEYLKEEKIYSWKITNVDPIGRARMHGELLLNAGELQSLYEFIQEKRSDADCPFEVTYACAHFVTLKYEREIRDFYFQCIAGTRLASVMANGDIGACLDIERRPELVQGNAYHDDFVEVWESRFRIFRRDRAQSSAVCRECTDKNICMGDSAHTWDYERNEPLYCFAERRGLLNRR